MPDNIFLTEERRDVLEGRDRGLTDQSLRNAKSRIRVRARLAFEELIEVAEGPGIETESVFDPADVHRFLLALNSPDQFQKEGQELPEEFREYRNDLYLQIDRVQRFVEGVEDANE